MDDDDNYIKLEFIGKGQGGTLVNKVKSLINKEYYALKKITVDYNNEKQNECNKNEIEIFKTLNHPNLIKYVTSYIKKGTLNIIMEYADGGDLTNQIKKYKNENKKIEEDLIWYWFLQICQGIRYMHSKKIIHRDIKCQNIFLTKENIVKLGDFGISKVLEHTYDFSKTPLGTPYFLSPEICSGSKYNFKIDMWMLGCVLYELTTFRKPFDGKTIVELIEKIQTKDILPIPKTYSDDLKNLISKLLCKNPNNRPSIKEILEYDFIINKMNKFGFTKRYIDWNEINNLDENINKNDPNYSLFNLRFVIDDNKDKASNESEDEDKDTFDETDERSEDLAKKLNNFNVSPSPNVSREATQDSTNKEIFQIKGKSYDNKINLPINNDNFSSMRQVSNINNPISLEEKIKSFKKNYQNNSDNQNENFNIKKDNKKTNFTLKYNNNKPKEIEFTDEMDSKNFKKKPTPNEIVKDNNYSKITIKYGFFCEQFTKEKMDKLIQKIEDCNGNLKDINNYIKENFASKLDDKLFLFSKYIVNSCY